MTQERKRENFQWIFQIHSMVVDLRGTFSIASFREIPYSRRFRSVKAGACASAASLMFPLLPATAEFSFLVSSITNGRTMYCCLPSTCKKKRARVMRSDAKQKPAAVAAAATCCCYAAQKTKYQLYSTREAQLKILSDIGSRVKQKRGRRFRFRAYRGESRGATRQKGTKRERSFPRSKVETLRRAKVNVMKNILRKEENERRADCNVYDTWRDRAGPHLS